MPTAHENLAARLLDTALQRGFADRVALRQGERAATYGELADRVARVATVLRSHEVEHGDRVALLTRDSIDAAVALLGIVHMGAVAVPLSELARARDIQKYLVHSGAVAVITDPALEPVVDAVRAQVPTLRHLLCLGPAQRDGASAQDLHPLIASAVPAAAAAAVTPGQTALIMYDATCCEQDPRGVPHAHSTPLSAYGSFAQGVIGLDMADRVFPVVRLSSTYGLGPGLLFPLAAGAEARLLPEQPHSEAIFEVLASYRPTVFLATPSIYGQLARDAEASGIATPLVGCRVCVSSAEGLPPKLVPKIREVLGAEVTVGYGLTEAFQFVFAGTASDGPVGNVGRPVPGFEARIVDEDTRPLGPDVIGTLQIRGPTVLSSYWGGEPSDDQFSDGWFTTRDRFMRDEHGNFYFCGRADDLFKVSGKWVSPIEVERSLMALEEVWDCAVIGADDEDGLIKPLAFVVPNIGHQPGPELEARLREHVKSELAPYKYPRWIEFRDKLPRGPGGKLLRYKLRPAKRSRHAETAGDATP